MDDAATVGAFCRGCCGIAVMAKASLPGRTKTRLVPPLTFDEAAKLNTAFLKDAVANVLAASRQEPVAGYVAYGPPGPESVTFFREILPPETGLLEASDPDFGMCLSSAIEQMLEGGNSSAVVLNSDSPTLPTALLVETAALLARPGDRAVLGPSTDGGYYLLGVKRRHPRLFEDIAWSTEHVKSQTLQRAREIGLQVHVLPAWYDVDDIESLKRLHGELFSGSTTPSGPSVHAAPHTSGLMSLLMSSTDFAMRLGLGAANVRRAAG
jgi:rSAM/selenodomain-associated transferase 1